MNIWLIFILLTVFLGCSGLGFVLGVALHRRLNANRLADMEGDIAALKARAGGAGAVMIDDITLAAAPE